MKRFLRNTLLFGLLVCAVLIVGEVLARRIPSPYSTKARYIEAHAGEITALVLGSSHTYYGVRPDVLGKGTFNLADISQTPEYDLVLLERYIGSMPRLRHVVPVSYCTYRDPALENSPEWSLGIRYKVESGLDVHSDFSFYNLMLSDFDLYRGKISNTLQDRPANRCDSLGYGLGYDLAHRKPWWKAGGEYHAQKHTQPYVGRDSVVLKKQYALIGLCRSHGVEPVFVTTPCWETYRRNVDAGQLAEMYRNIAALVDSTGVKYYDFFADSRFADDDFYDVDHLSEVGAAKFSRLLRELLNDSVPDPQQP